MPTAESVAAFIARNNAFLDKIEDQLDQATNNALGQDERDRALATAGHLACRGLRRLRDAEVELWDPLRQQGPTLFPDENPLADRAPPGGQHQAPRVPVNKELLQRFRHPDPDQAEQDIKQADRLLHDVVLGSADGIERLIDQAKANVAELAEETCQLVDKRADPQLIRRLVRRSAGMLATANLAAAAAALQQHGWQAAPGLLRDAAAWFQHGGRSIDALPWVSLIAGATVVVEAAKTVRLARSVSADNSVSQVRPVATERQIRFAEEIESAYRKQEAEQSPDSIRPDSVRAVTDAALNERDASKPDQTRRSEELLRRAREVAERRADDPTGGWPSAT